MKIRKCWKRTELKKERTLQNWWEHDLRSVIRIKSNKNNKETNKRKQEKKLAWSNICNQNSFEVKFSLFNLWFWPQRKTSATYFPINSSVQGQNIGAYLKKNQNHNLSKKPKPKKKVCIYIFFPWIKSMQHL